MRVYTWQGKISFDLAEISTKTCGYRLTVGMGVLEFQ